MELGGAAEGLGDAETVHLLQLGGGVDGYGGLGEGWDGVGQDGEGGAEGAHGA